MRRPPRENEANGIPHVLNRGNRPVTIFHKPEDFETFEPIMAEALDHLQIQLFADGLFPHHWHMVVSPEVDGEMGRFGQWLGLTHTQRHRAHDQTAGEGHLYQGRFESFPVQDDNHFLAVCGYVERNAYKAKLRDAHDQWRFGSLWRWANRTKAEKSLLAPWPIPRRHPWLDFVAAPLSEKEQKSKQRSIAREVPYGDKYWVPKTVRHFGLESTVRARGRSLKLPKYPYRYLTPVSLAVAATK